MNIAVDGNNFFYTGWVACLLSLPRKHPGEGALKPGDINAFNDGWDTCYETPRAEAFKVLHQERRLGHVTVAWVDDDNNEIV